MLNELPGAYRGFFKPYAVLDEEEGAAEPMVVAQPVTEKRAKLDGAVVQAQPVGRG